MSGFFIGVTGGVGAGKSRCLDYITEQYRAFVIHADDEAASLKKRGGVCFDALVSLLSEEVLDARGEIDNAKMAARVLGDPALLAKVNGIIHPAVNAHIRLLIAEKKASGLYDFIFVEAALLIENGYEDFVDEMWYIYADEDIRRKRLKTTRGYSDARIDELFARQLSDAEFRAHCAVVIDNGDDFIETRKQIDRVLKEHIGGTKRSAD